MSEARNFPNIQGILFVILEFLFLVLKILSNICEAAYRLLVPRKKKSVIGEVVLITGAGHGIGRELAIGYASLGATVVCWDINEETNKQTMNIIKKMGKGSVHVYRCDVSDKNEVFKVAEKVKKEVGDITILINNAAVAPVRTFQNYDINEISWVMNVNLMAHYWTMKTFLPNMIEKDHGHVVAISSITTLYGGTHGSLYCVTKTAIRALMESISEELRAYSKGKSSVKFTTIFPSVVTTGLDKNIRLKFPRLIGVYSAQQAASLIIDAQRRDFKEKAFRSHLFIIFTILRLFPDKALMNIMDFVGFNSDADD